MTFLLWCLWGLVFAAELVIVYRVLVRYEDRIVSWLHDQAERLEARRARR